MSKPIPDEALRRAVQAMAAGDKISLLTEAGHETILVKQVFSELLALREAARRVAGEYDIAELIDAILEMRDLLPKEAP